MKMLGRNFLDEKVHARATEKNRIVIREIISLFLTSTVKRKNPDYVPHGLENYIYKVIKTKQRKCIF